jgi:hypothetical protein
VEVDQNVTTAWLLSFNDSNSIKVVLYDKNCKHNLRENMIIFIKSAPVKIDKNFAIILENPLESSIRILGLLSPEESNKLNKFRFDKKKDMDCLIDLTQPILVRCIQKVLKL